MKSLKQFITENLEISDNTVQENTEKQIKENSVDKTVDENSEAEKNSIEDK